MKVVISIFKNHTVFFGLLFIFFLIFLSYHQVLTSYFVSDDWEWIQKIEPLNLWQVYKIFLPQSFGGIESAFWRPVIPFVFWINYKSAGLNPFFYHLTNFVFHLANVLLAYLVALRLFQNKDKNLTKLVALSSALFFGVFPLHSEAVSWIEGRYDVLMTFFYLSSLFTFILFLKKSHFKFLFLSLIAFFIALLTKEPAVTLPIAIILSSLLLGRGLSLPSSLPYFIILFIWLLIKISFVPATFGHFAYHGFFISRPFLVYLASFSFVIVFSVLLKTKFFKNFVFLWLLLGIFLQPAAFLPTQERFLYLPSIAAAFIFGDVIILIYSSLSSIFSKKLIFTTLAIFVFLLSTFEATLLFLRNFRWVEAGKIAKKIVLQTKFFTEDSNYSSTLYFLNVPDNFQGALIYRSYLDTALKYNGVKFGKVYILTTINGVGETKIFEISNQKLKLESQSPFVIFRPAVSQYLPNGDILIENPQASIAINNGLKEAKIQLKQDYIGKNNIYFFYYDDGKIYQI